MYYCYTNLSLQQVRPAGRAAQMNHNSSGGTRQTTVFKEIKCAFLLKSKLLKQIFCFNKEKKSSECSFPSFSILTLNHKDPTVFKVSSCAPCSNLTNHKHLFGKVFVLVLFLSLINFLFYFIFLAALSPEIGETSGANTGHRLEAKEMMVCKSKKVNVLFIS